MNDIVSVGVLIVDDHAIAREGLVAVIGSASGLHVAGVAVSGEEAIEEYRRLRPDVTLMDLHLPGISGIEAIEAIRAVDAEARVVVLTTYGGDAQALRALKAGAAGYLLKTASGSELVESIRAVFGGARRISGEVANEIANHATSQALTQREIEVLGYVAAGMPNKEVARRLAISHETVKEHMRNLMEKLDAGDRTHAVTIAIRRRIIELDA